MKECYLTADYADCTDFFFEEVKNLRNLRNLGSLLMSGEHAQTALRLHLENERDERLIPAVDSKRPGGGLDHFFECIRRGERSPNDLASARHSLAVALAMQESARSGEVVAVG
ncbi:MAG: hypothetical protein R2911_45320 [Caldilineaceae bacterium]